MRYRRGFSYIIVTVKSLRKSLFERDLVVFFRIAERNTVKAERMRLRQTRIW